MKFDFVFIQIYIWNNGDGVAKIFTYCFCDYYTENLTTFADGLLNPPHVPGKLTHCSVRTIRPLKLKYEKSATFIDGQNINWPDRRRKLNPVSPCRIDE